jgi:hypothetical protein
LTAAHGYTRLPSLRRAADACCALLRSPVQIGISTRGVRRAAGPEREWERDRVAQAVGGRLSAVLAHAALLRTL